MIDGAGLADGSMGSRRAAPGPEAEGRRGGSRPTRALLHAPVSVAGRHCAALRVSEGPSGGFAKRASGALSGCVATE